MIDHAPPKTFKAPAERFLDENRTRLAERCGRNRLASCAQCDLPALSARSHGDRRAIRGVQQATYVRSDRDRGQCGQAAMGAQVAHPGNGRQIGGSRGARHDRGNPCSTSASASISLAQCALLAASNGVSAGSVGWGCECHQAAISVSNIITFLSPWCRPGASPSRLALCAPGFADLRH